ncbi:hypothetical protein MKEN_00922300 [Mycena kentingensis (nom. inval.)]|nr:hypothetical protein MKEN_00922300 [Mycena kentingensis (nom. inval.)]
MPLSPSLLRYDPATTPKRNITLDDYDALPNSLYRDRIEDIVLRALSSEHVEKLLAPKGPIWPMDIFCAARDVLDADPDVSENSLYFTCVSTVLCRALNALRIPSPPAQKPLSPSDPSPAERRAMRQRIVANVHGAHAHYLAPLRIQLLRHQHLQWTMRMNRGGKISSLSGYTSSDSDESEEEVDVEIVYVPAVPRVLSI